MDKKNKASIHPITAMAASIALGFRKDIKFSTAMAAAALLGRESCDGERGLKDAALAAIIAKNEILDKDGVVRKMVDQGASDSELHEMQEALNKELEKREAARKPSIISEKLDEIESKRGFLGAFVRGFRS